MSGKTSSELYDPTFDVIEMFVPSKGYNLVAIGSYSKIDASGSFLIAHFDTQSAALNAQKRFGEDNTVVVFPAKIAE